MPILKIDRALYDVDDATKTYKYYGRNPNWQHLSNEEIEETKDIYMDIRASFPMDGEEFLG